METKCGLTRMIIGSKAFLDIDPLRYESIRSAKRALGEALSFELKFELVVANLIELEKTLNAIAVDSLYQQDYDYSSLQDSLLLINLRALNLLSACRGYLDHGAHHASALEACCPSLHSQFTAEVSRQYDESASYRLADALRNHAQHQGLAVAGASIGGERVESQNGDSIVRHSVQAWIDTQALLESERTKARVREYLRALPERVNARAVLRDYVASLATVHACMRKQLSGSVSQMELILEQAMSDFRQAFPKEESVVGLAAVRCDESGRRHDEVALFADFIAHRRTMERRNVNLEHLSNWHVSSEPPRRKSKVAKK